MHIKIGFDIQLAIASPMALVYVLHVHPSRRDDLLAPEVVLIEPQLQADEYLDAFGNQCGRVNAPVGVGEVRFHSESIIRDPGLPDEVDWAARQHDPTELPPATLQFLLPSRYCEVDSELLQFAWNQFGQAPAGWARVQAICDYVHHHIHFNYNAARATRTAVEGWREGTGVCRDYTHLAVTLCRCMNIPARYCTGYLGDIGIPPVPYPMDFSAWFEVFLGGRWYTFDARHNTPRIGRVVMARGRDAGDVPLTMAFGPNTLKKFEVTTYEVDTHGNAISTV
ncbi:transglutaminase family protein [Polaromonas sp.]|uniref:transglutaminase-like domain-containing protein n=1 Tax=Polaromonas sp. TaxID=1869339 RepID=UPI0013BCC17D|nr:transglutaminase family protein [Polaromonas sp.]NDP62045.1 transglutaminase family protein [Polaromonas sp.]